MASDAVSSAQGAVLFSSEDQSIADEKGQPLIDIDGKRHKNYQVNSNEGGVSSTVGEYFSEQGSPVGLTNKASLTYSLMCSDQIDPEKVTFETTTTSLKTADDSELKLSECLEALNLQDSSVIDHTEHKSFRNFLELAIKEQTSYSERILSLDGILSIGPKLGINVYKCSEEATVDKIQDSDGSVKVILVNQTKWTYCIESSNGNIKFEVNSTNKNINVSITHNSENDKSGPNTPYVIKTIRDVKGTKLEIVSSNEVFTKEKKDYSNKEIDTILTLKPNPKEDSELSSFCKKLREEGLYQDIDFDDRIGCLSILAGQHNFSMEILECDISKETAFVEMQLNDIIVKMDVNGKSRAMQFSSQA